MFITELRHTIALFLYNVGFNNDWSGRLAQILIVGLLLLALCIVAALFKRYLIPLILKIVEKTNTQWDD